MSVEIKQLVIRAVVEAHEVAPERALRPRREAEEGDPGLGQREREAIVADCAREVLRALERRRGR